MVTAHTKTGAELKGLADTGKVMAELPTALDGSHQSKLDKLKDEGGKDFSSDFNSDQARIGTRCRCSGVTPRAVTTPT